MEVEVVGVNASGADQVVEDDAVVALKEGDDSVPGGLVRAESVGEDHHFLSAAHYSNVQNL